MATIVKKNIKGHAYYYAVQTGWVEGRSRVIWQKYLGKAEDIVAKLEGLGAEPYTARVFCFGAVAALYQVAAELGVVAIIDQFAPKRNQGPSVGEYMLIAGRLGSGTAKPALSRWLKARPEHLSSQGSTAKGQQPRNQPAASAPQLAPVQPAQSPGEVFTRRLWVGRPTGLTRHPLRLGAPPSLPVQEKRMPVPAERNTPKTPPGTPPPPPPPGRQPPGCPPCRSAGRPSSLRSQRAKSRPP